MRKNIGRVWQSLNHRAEDLSSYLTCFGALRGGAFLASGLLRTGSAEKTVQVTAPGMTHTLALRLGSSDVQVFNDIYHGGECSWEFAQPPRIILDAGAYTGLSTAYFAARYPDALVIAVEPSTSNFELLIRNVATFNNVRAINAALWNESGALVLTDPGWGPWGFSVREPGGAESATVRAVTIPDIMQECAVEHVDLLKLDIEGSEKEVLSDSASWIKHVTAISVELHDRFKPGCTRAFYGAVTDFPIELRHGEKVLVARDPSPLTPIAG